MMIYLDFGATDPSDSRKVVLHQQVVRFIVKAPLANDQIRTRVLHALNHVQEFILFVALELFELFDARDVELVLCLGPRWLEWAGENGDACILHLARHLRMRHVFVDEHALDELRVCKRTADFAIDFDEIEPDVFAFQIGDLQHRVDGDLCELLVFFRYTAQGAGQCKSAGAVTKM